MGRSKALLTNTKVPFSNHPKCILAIDKESMESEKVFKNLVGDGSPRFEFKNKVPINNVTGGLEFRGTNIARAGLPKEHLRKYTVLVHAKPEPSKSENDVIGSDGLSTSDMLLMVYIGNVRPHQWPLVGGAMIIQGNKNASEYFGQMVDGSATTTLYLINNKKIEQQLHNPTYGSELKPIVTIGGRSPGYDQGFFSGELYGVRWYEDVLTEEEILAEFQNMEDRRAN